MELPAILEALLFSSQRPLSPRELKEILARAADESGDAAVQSRKVAREKEIQAALEKLAADYQGAERSYQLSCVAGSWQFVSRPEYAPWVKALVGEKLRPARLSQPALETLAIIAYRQPLTRAEIEQIRGVSVDGVLQTLLERGLVEQAGRSEVIGRPMTYGTTTAFLEYFGLRSLDELPGGEELRRLPVEKPPSLLTVDAGLATAPPETLSIGKSGAIPEPGAAPEGGPHSSQAESEAESGIPSNGPAEIS